jgi:hypothetical protein
MRSITAGRAPERDWIALANSDMQCRQCFGSGRRARSVCNCVHRSIFSQCLERYILCAENSERFNRIAVLEVSAGGRLLVGLKCAEYAADFELAARRVLTPRQQELLRIHFLESKPWKEAAPLLRMNRGEFFHEVYRTESILGKELARAGVYPLDEYFGVRRLSFSSPESWGGKGRGPEIHNFHRQALRAAA